MNLRDIQIFIPEHNVYMWLWCWHIRRPKGISLLAFFTSSSLPSLSVPKLHLTHLFYSHLTTCALSDPYSAPYILAKGLPFHPCLAVPISQIWFTFQNRSHGHYPVLKHLGSFLFLDLLTEEKPFLSYTPINKLIRQPTAHLVFMVNDIVWWGMERNQGENLRSCEYLLDP